MEPDEITKRFAPSKADPIDMEALNSNRKAINDAALRINRNIIDGRYKALAFTALEEALFWANKAVFE